MKLTCYPTNPTSTTSRGNGSSRWDTDLRLHDHRAGQIRRQARSKDNYSCASCEALLEYLKIENSYDVDTHMDHMKPASVSLKVTSVPSTGKGWGAMALASMHASFQRPSFPRHALSLAPPIINGQALKQLAEGTALNKVHWKDTPFFWFTSCRL